MQTKKLLKILLVSITVLLLALSVNVYAEPDEEVSEGKEEITMTLEELLTNSMEVKEPKNGDLYLINQDVTIDYAVYGNVFIMANSVTIDSEINGNVFVMANNIKTTENSYVYQDMFVMGNEINISGYIYDIYAMCNKLSINSVIARDVHAGCSQFTLKGVIGRDTQLSADEIKFEDTAAIGGNLDYTSSKEAKIPENLVNGKINFNKVEVEKEAKQEESKPIGIIVVQYVKDLLKTLVYGLLVVLAIVFLMKNYAEREAEVLSTKLGPTLGYGALALIAIPFAALILLITVIGIPVSLFLVTSYIFALTVSTPVLSLAISKIICNKKNIDKKGMLILFSGLFIAAFWGLKQLPFLGFFVSLGTTLFGLGIIAYTIVKAIKKPSKKENAEAKSEVKIEAKAETKVEEVKEDKKAKKTK